MQTVWKMTFLAYSVFFFNGIFNLLPGVLLMNIAKSFEVDTHIIGYIFSLLVLGNVLAVQVNGRLLEKVDIRKVFFGGTGVILIAVLGIATATKLPFFAVFILLCGFGSGIFTSAASYLIVNLYDAQERSAKLNLLHFTFSVGAIISPLISGNLLNMGVPWQHIYWYVLLLLCAIFILVFITEVKVKKRPQVQGKVVKEKWGAPIYAIAIALCCYMIAEQSFIFWGNTYFIECLSFNMAESSLLVSLFWAFMALGRVSSGLILRHITVEKYILICSSLGFISFILMLNSFAFFTVCLFVALMGLGFSGLYASILSYETLQLKYPSAELMSMCITFGYIGGILSTPLSSFIKSLLGLKLSLMTSASFMAAIFIIITLTKAALLRRKQHKTHGVL